MCGLRDTGFIAVVHLHIIPQVLELVLNFTKGPLCDAGSIPMVHLHIVPQASKLAFGVLAPVLLFFPLLFPFFSFLGCQFSLVGYRGNICSCCIPLFGSRGKIGAYCISLVGCYGELVICIP